MTQLLVSVRNAAEALIALEAGADLIDVKEPWRGSLGAADAETIAAVVHTVKGRVPVSVAMGELVDQPRQALMVPRGVQFAKVGLHACANEPDWAIRWKVFVNGLAANVNPVAVVYADTENAHAPPADEIIRGASDFGCRAVLVDTFDKSSGPITSHWTGGQIHRFVLEVQSRGMLAVIAGGLTASLIAQVLVAQPDVIAVRGAACHGDRTATVDARKVCQLKAIIDAMGGGVGNSPQTRAGLHANLDEPAAGSAQHLLPLGQRFA